MKSNSAIKEKEKVVIQAFADLYDLLFPDSVPESTDSKPLEYAGHYGHCGIEGLRTRRIKAALKKLPLSKIIGDIRTAANALDEAFNERQSKELELGKLNAMLSNILDGSTPDPRAVELEGQISTLRGWLAVAAELNRMCEKLFQELSKASRLLCPLQHLQSRHQQAWVAIGVWAGSLPHAAKAAVEPRAKALAKIANNALTEIERLQAGETPALRNTGTYSVILNVPLDVQDEK